VLARGRASRRQPDHALLRGWGNIPLQLVAGSVQGTNLRSSDYQNFYRTVPVTTERFVWPAQTLLDGSCRCGRLAVVSGR
jgi:hypothetical protein